MTQVKMPQLGETVIEGTILKWLKQEGDDVAQDEPLFEISTDKVDTEVPSPAAGKLTKILVDEGATVSVGTDVATIEAGDGANAAAPVEAAAQPEAATKANIPSEVPDGAAAGTPVQTGAPVETPQVEPAAMTPANVAPAVAAEQRPTATATMQAPTEMPAPPQAAPMPDRGPRSSILSPLVRRLAEEHGIDLGKVQGSGTGGRITKKDVLAFVSAGGASRQGAQQQTPQQGAPSPAPAAATPTPSAMPAPAVAQTTPAGEGTEVVPMTHIRRAIANHMHASTQTTARAWTMVEVDVDHLVKLRESKKSVFRERFGVNLTYLPFVVRATVDALQEYPYVNARLDGDNIVLHRFVNMGIAVSYDAGLIVPVIKGADGMNSIGIARAISDLAGRARGRQLKPDEVQGGTFTITNPGPYGSVASVPIISTPNVGILSLDAIVKRPVVIDDAIAIRSMVNVSMSWDHRTIDGELATRFLARVKANLEGWDFAEDLGV
ncbi:MAG TPA: dihydrolipoamide acetyltransferase family protein [Actinomycetota bacterium]|nr:dihydrolipoamide acetyltransferase family protein [Actinomycetota bacterium]